MTPELVVGSFPVKEGGGRAFQTEGLANAQPWGSEQFPLVLEAVGLGVSGRQEGKESRKEE